MEQSYCSELVVVMSHTVYYYYLLIYFMGLSKFRISTSVLIMCQIATRQLQSGLVAICISRNPFNIKLLFQL
jgi:hypothetical protein